MMIEIQLLYRILNMCYIDCQVSIGGLEGVNCKSCISSGKARCDPNGCPPEYNTHSGATIKIVYNTKYAMHIILTKPYTQAIPSNKYFAEVLRCD